MANDLKVVILAGGRGTRLAPYTSVLPKPLMPIGDRAILEIVLDQLRSHGFRDVILSVGYLAHLIQAVLEHHTQNGGGKAPPVRISYVYEDAPLGTAGPLRLIEGLDRTFVVMNGDLLTTLDFSELLRAHRNAGNLLTIATKKRTIKLDYGVLHLEDTAPGTARVVGYDEKPEFASTVSMGVYVLEPAILEYVPAAGPFDFPDLVHALLAAGRPVGAYEHDGLWFDIGRPDDYERATAAWSDAVPLAQAPGGALVESRDDRLLADSVDDRG